MFFKLKLSGFLVLLITLTITINFTLIQTQDNKDENIRIRYLLDIIPRFQGKAYSAKIDVKFDSNKFKCQSNYNVSPKEYSFLSNSGYSICSDKMFENFEPLAEKINTEISQNIDDTLTANVNFLNEFKQVLYFAYYLTYLQNIVLNEKKVQKPKDNFFDEPKLSHTQIDLLENLPNYDFNLFTIGNEDLKILNNYLHTDIDLNIMQLQRVIDNIIGKIENFFARKDGFKDWIPKSKDIVKNFIAAIWKDAINIDFE